MTRAIEFLLIWFPICDAIEMRANGREGAKIVSCPKDVQFVFRKEGNSRGEIVRLADFEPRGGFIQNLGNKSLKCPVGFGTQSNDNS
jgi:hypothetical protein